MNNFLVFKEFSDSNFRYVVAVNDMSSYMFCYSYSEVLDFIDSHGGFDNCILFSKLFCGLSKEAYNTLDRGESNA